MKGLLLLLPAMLLATSLRAQTNQTPQALGATLDDRLFDAYNRCDLPAFGALLAPEVEFYHDKGGPMLGRQALMEAVERNICGQVSRELIPGSLQSYPMDNYGLVQLGEHRFCTPGTNECTGTGKFVHLWKRTGNQWQATRIISYDHAPL